MGKSVRTRSGKGSSNQSQYSPAEERYVGWLDVMGSGLMMEHSFAVARYRVFLFHAFAIHAKVHASAQRTTDVKVIPMGDGLFVVTKKLDALLEFIDVLYASIVKNGVDVIRGKNPHQAFLVRAAIAHGSVGSFDKYLGSLRRKAPDNYKQHAQNVLVGPPVSVAYRHESLAPPMGIFVHTSVLQRECHINGSMNEVQLSSPYHRWKYDGLDVLQFVDDYFTYQDEHAHELGYDKSRSQQYREMAQEYFQKK